MQTQRTLTPKNGQFPVALLAGGPSDLAREISARLSEKLGVVVTTHWAGDKPNQWKRSIPENVDVAIFLKDFSSHAQEHLLSRQCGAQSVPLVRTQRKWGAMYAALNAQYGMTTATAWKPSEEALTAPVQEPPNLPAPEWVEPPAPVVAAPVEEPKPKRVRAPRKPKQDAPPTATPVPFPEPVRPRGSPSVEAMALIGQLMALAARDRFNVMITPEEVTISGGAK